MCSEYLYQLSKEYLNILTRTFYAFSRQYSETFDISHAFFPLTIAHYQLLNAVHFLAHSAYNIIL